MQFCQASQAQVSKHLTDDWRSNSITAVSSVMHWVGAKLKFKIGCPFAPASRRRRLSVMDVDGGGAPPHRGRGRGWRGHVAGSPLLIGASECTPTPTHFTDRARGPETTHQSPTRRAHRPRHDRQALTQKSHISVQYYRANIYKKKLRHA